MLVFKIAIDFHTIILSVFQGKSKNIASNQDWFCFRINKCKIYLSDRIQLYLVIIS